MFGSERQFWLGLQASVLAFWQDDSSETIERVADRAADHAAEIAVMPDPLNKLLIYAIVALSAVVYYLFMDIKNRGVRLGEKLDNCEQELHDCEKDKLRAAVGHPATSESSTQIPVVLPDGAEPSEADKELIQKLKEIEDSGIPLDEQSKKYLLGGSEPDHE